MTLCGCVGKKSRHFSENFFVSYVEVITKNTEQSNSMTFFSGFSVQDIHILLQNVLFETKILFVCYVTLTQSLCRKLRFSKSKCRKKGKKSKSFLFLSWHALGRCIEFNLYVGQNERKALILK